MDEIKIGEILAPVSETKQEQRSEKVGRDFWPKFRRVARRIPKADELVAAYFAAMDPKTPIRVRGTLLAALAYFILPLDTIPDFLLGLGFTDDIAVLTAAIATVRGAISPAHRLAAKKALAEDNISDPTKNA